MVRAAPATGLRLRQIDIPVRDAAPARRAQRSSRHAAMLSTRAASPTLGGPGAIAQLGERVLCKHEVAGSIPAGSIRQSPEATRHEASLPPDSAKAEVAPRAEANLSVLRAILFAYGC